MDFEKAREQYNEKISALKNLNDEQKEKIYNETSELIKYFENMSSKAENKRSSIFSSAINNMNLIIAFLTLIITINVKFAVLSLLPCFIPIYTFAGLSLINDIIISFVFWKQSSCKYVTKDSRLANYGNYWKWFYYGNSNILNISTSLKKNIKVSGKNQNNAFDEDSVEAYLNGLCFVIEKYTTENSEDKVEKNIKQLYLMQVLNYYKNRYNMLLTSINNLFTIIKIFGVILSIVIVLIVF